MHRFSITALLSTTLLLTTAATGLGQSYPSDLLSQRSNPRRSNPQPTIIDSNWSISTEGQLQQNQRFNHEFRGEANQTVTISATSHQFDTYLELYDTNGRLLAENDDIDRQGNSQIRVTLPRTGPYTVVVRGFHHRAQGSFNLTIQGGDRVSASPRPQEPRPYPLPSPRPPQPPTPPQPAPRREARQVNHLFSGDRIQHLFHAQAGEELRIRVESTQFDTYLTLYDANQRILAENDDANGSNSTIRFRVPQTGQYTAEVRAYDHRSQGDYELIIGR